MTTHREDVTALRHNAEQSANLANELGLAADLLEMHDRRAVSLDNWQNAREFVERHIDHTIQENGV